MVVAVRTEHDPTTIAAPDIEQRTSSRGRARWQPRWPAPLPRPRDAWESHALAPDLSRLTLRFAVSRNEEYVALSTHDDHRTIDLGARAHHLVLLALARSRLADREARSASPSDLGAPRSDGAEGWIYLDELAAQLAMDETHLNVAVFRSRRQLAQIGILGAVGIVERRRLTHELRLGVARIELETV